VVAKKKNLLSIAGVYLVIIFFFSLINIWLNMSLGSAILFYVYIVSIFMFDKMLLLKYLHVFYAGIFAITATLIIEYSNIYLPELWKNSFPAHSTTLLVIWYSLIIITIQNRENKTKMTNNKYGDIKYSKSTRMALRILLTLLVVGLFSASLTYFLQIVKQPYWILNIRRFAYKQRYFDSLMLIFFTSFIYAVPVLLKEKRHFLKILSVVSILLYLASCVLYGEKFNAFWQVGIILIFYNLNKNINIPNLFQKYKKYFFLVFLLVIALLTYTIMQYTILNVDPLTSLVNRMAQQGQLWWGTYSGVNANGAHPFEFFDEILNPIFNPHGYDYSVYKIMYFNAPQSVVDSVISSGSAYTESTAATFYYYFDFLGIIIFAPLIGLLWSWVTNYLLHLFSTESIIETVLVCRLYFIISAISTNSRFYNLFDIQSILTIVFIAFVYLSNRKRVLVRGLVS